jgi:hypothetical protein
MKKLCTSWFTQTASFAVAVCCLWSCKDLTMVNIAQESEEQVRQALMATRWQETKYFDNYFRGGELQPFEGSIRIKTYSPNGLGTIRTTVTDTTKAAFFDGTTEFRWWIEEEQNPTDKEQLGRWVLKERHLRVYTVAGTVIPIDTINVRSNNIMLLNTKELKLGGMGVHGPAGFYYEAVP